MKTLHPAPPPGAPLFTPLLTHLLFDRALTAELLRSYTRLYACAWPSGYRSLGPLELEGELAPLMGVGRSQAYLRLRQLRLARLLEWETDGQNRYTLHFASAPLQHSAPHGRADTVVDESKALKSLNLISEGIQQHQTDSALATRPAARAEATEADQPPPDERVRSALLRAGIWPDVAEKLAHQFAGYRQRSYNTYLPDLSDVLGWIAYCFADRKKNKIVQPAAVLAANLRQGRRCPEEYRPPWICAGCDRLLKYCDCEAGPQPHLPEEFLELAFCQPNDYSLTSDPRWHVCHTCRCFPCHCNDWDDEEEWELEEEADEGEADQAPEA